MKNKILLFTCALFLIMAGTKTFGQIQCQAGFTTSQQGTVVQFTDSSSVVQGSIANYFWSFGDGTSGNTQNPVHQYAGAGNYTVCLTITSTLGCVDTTCQTITVGGCGMTITVVNVQPNLLNATISGGTPPYNYSWQYNGVVLSTSQVLTVVNTGIYCLTITDANGCSASNCINYTGGGASCQAYFGFNILPGTPVQVQFWDTSYVNSGQVLNWAWNLGDGSSSTASQFTHIYTSPGTYLVCLNIQTTGGCQSSYCDTIVIGNCTLAATVVDSLGTYFPQITGGTAPYSYLWNTGATTQGIMPTTTGNYCVTVSDGNGCSVTACKYFNAALTDTICGQIFIDANGNGIFDAGEAPVTSGWVTGWGGGMQFSAQIDSSGQYTANVSPGTYTINYCPGVFVTFTIPVNNDSSGCAHYDNVVISGGTNCGYNFGFQYNSVTITGCVFFDANNNGTKDGSETGIPYQSVQVGSNWGYTDANGNYNINVVPGTVNISYTLQPPYTGATLTTPGVITLTGTTAGNTYANNNFGVYLPPGSNNLSVTLTPHTTITPGFGAWYDIQVCNIGSTVTGGVLNMYFDAGLTFDYASPAQSSISGNQIAWNLPVLAPGSCANYWVSFDASLSYVIGDNTYEVASVYPSNGNDIDMSDNIDTVHQVVTASWDPNNKIPVVTNNNNPNYQLISSVNADQTITYTINFQNLGTAPAVNISVMDLLSSDLVASSFQMLNSSHNAIVSRNGSNLLFRFSNIQLPDATTNEPASHGWITFKVNAQNGLAIGHIISDDAAIYFDFNTPVITNDAAVELIGPTGIKDLDATNISLNVYPNPASDIATVSYSLLNAGDVQIKLTDVQGKVVTQAELKNEAAGKHSFAVNANALSKGVYLLQVTTSSQSKTLKLNIIK